MTAAKQSCLMLGSGHTKPFRKLACPVSGQEHEIRWVRLDNNPASEPDILFDLEKLEHGAQLPVPESSFEEIHAYEILEHFGTQGNYRGFFNTFRELWRVLKPGGHLIGTCPSLKSEWLWADPGHTRVICQGTLSFLTKDHYTQLGATASSDYRGFVQPCWWTFIYARETADNFLFCLKKVA